MAVINEGITVNSDKTLNFGNYMVKEKIKVKDFEVDGNIYSIKTHNEVTRLEQNGKLLIECVPGASVFNLKMDEGAVTFSANGRGDTNITLELAPETEYRFFVDSAVIGTMKSTISGKISFSVELSETGKAVKIAKQ